MTRNSVQQRRWLPLVVGALTFGAPMPVGASDDQAAPSMDGEIAGVVLDADGPSPPPTIPRARPHISAERLLGGQPMPTSFDAVPIILEQGHEVIVTDAGGLSMRGRVSSISTSELVLIRKRFPFSRLEARRLAEESITTIRIVDPTRNGALLGAGVAVGVLAALIERACTPACDDNFGRAGRWIIQSALFVPIGWSVGRVIDSSINEPIYERPQKHQVIVSPLIQGDRKGLVVQFSF